MQATSNLLPAGVDLHQVAELWSQLWVALERLAQGTGPQSTAPQENLTHEDPEVEAALASPQRLLSAGDMARLLGVDVRTVRRWRCEGRLPPAIAIGGVVRWRPETVDAWLTKAEEHRT